MFLNHIFFLPMSVRCFHLIFFPFCGTVCLLFILSMSVRFFSDINLFCVEHNLIIPSPVIAVGVVVAAPMVPRQPRGQAGGQGQRLCPAWMPA